MLRDQGRDLHAEFLNLLPARPQPIRIQRWSARRVALLMLMVPAAILLAVSFRTVLVNSDATTTPLAIDSPGCDELEPLWLEAQSVPSASLVPCVRSLPEGWTLGAANVRNGWSRFTLDHDRVGRPALVVRLTATCDTTGATPTPSDQPGTRRYERTEPGHSDRPTTSYTVFPGGCVTAQLRSTSNGDASLIDEAASAIGFTTRDALATSTRPTLQRATPPRPGRSGMTVSHRHRPEPARKGHLVHTFTIRKCSSFLIARCRQRPGGTAAATPRRHADRAGQRVQRRRRLRRADDGAVRSRTANDQPSTTQPSITQPSATQTSTEPSPTQPSTTQPSTTQLPTEPGPSVVVLGGPLDQDRSEPHIAVDPEDPERMFVVAQGALPYVALDPQLFWRTEDGGRDLE